MRFQTNSYESFEPVDTLCVNLTLYFICKLHFWNIFMVRPNDFTDIKLWRNLPCLCPRGSEWRRCWRHRNVCCSQWFVGPWLYGASLSVSLTSTWSLLTLKREITRNYLLLCLASKGARHTWPNPVFRSNKHSESLGEISLIRNIFLEQM